MASVVDTRQVVRDLEFPFTLERAESDGRTFEGLAAVFNSPTPISDQRGDYIETVAPGAFTKSIKERTPVLMYNHGRSAPIGDIPIGKITEIREVPEGLFVRARLVDNPTINIVRDAIRDQAITGMSFRSKIIRDAWATRGGQRYCTLKELSVVEVGPVATPAYRDTTATVRSMLQDVGMTYPELVRVEWLGRDEDAEVTTWDQSPADMIADMIGDKWGLGEINATVHIIDLFADHAIFTVYPAGHTQYPGLWQVSFSKNADGSMTVADPGRPPLADYNTSAQSNTPKNDEPSKATAGAPSVDGPQGAVNKVASADDGETVDREKDFSTSEDAAMSTSSDAAVRAITPRTKEQVMKQIAMRRRGIRT